MAIYGDEKHNTNEEHTDSKKNTDIGLALDWFLRKDITAYEDFGNILVVLNNEDETHVEISDSEINFRAEAQRDWLKEEEDEDE